MAIATKNDGPWSAKGSTYIAFFLTKIKCWAQQKQKMQIDVPK